MTGSPPDSSTRSPRGWSVLAATVFLLVQVAVPTWLLFQPRLQRFGWHMYSALPPTYEMVVTDSAGRAWPVDAGLHLAKRRADVQDDERVRLARVVCAEEPRAVSVRVELRRGEPQHSVPCR